jgi:hypothetical protein
MGNPGFFGPDVKSNPQKTCKLHARAAGVYSMTTAVPLAEAIKSDLFLEPTLS